MYARKPGLSFLRLIFTGKSVLLFAAFFLLVPLFTGCSEKDTVVIPLKTGEVHTYSGKYVSRGGAGKTITLAAEDHRLVVEREFDFKGEKRYLVHFTRGEDRIVGMILTQSDDGLYAIFGRNNKVLLIPKDVKSGQSWKHKWGNRTSTIKVGGRKNFNTGLGKLEGREISITTTERTRIKFWINDTYGIIALHYSYIEQGANRTEADLVLQKVGNLESPPKEDNGKQPEGEEKKD